MVRSARIDEVKERSSTNDCNTRWSRQTRDVLAGWGRDLVMFIVKYNVWSGQPSAALHAGAAALILVIRSVMCVLAVWVARAVWCSGLLQTYEVSGKELGSPEQFSSWVCHLQWLFLYTWLTVPTAWTKLKILGYLAQYELTSTSCSRAAKCSRLSIWTSWMCRSSPRSRSHQGIVSLSSEWNKLS